MLIRLLREAYWFSGHRGDRTAIELFVAGVSVWEARLQRSVGRMGIEVDHLFEARPTAPGRRESVIKQGGRTRRSVMPSKQTEQELSDKLWKRV